MINENAVGIHKPIKFKINAGFDKPFKKIRTKENTKTITEYEKTILRTVAELLI